MSQPRNPTHTYTVPSVSIATAHPRQKNPPEQVGMTPPSAPAFTETQSPA
jgi:hypothetical protein